MKEYTDKGLSKEEGFEPYHVDIGSIAGLVVMEDASQIAKWGYQTHTLFEWLTCTTEEFGELAKAILEFINGDGDKERIVKEAIQTATLCLKIAKMVKECK